MNNFSIKSIIILAVCILAILAGVVWFFFFNTGFLNNVVLEAGEPLTMQLFFENDVPEDALFVTDLDSFSTSETGTYGIEISVGKKTHTSTLTVRDTTDPKVTIKSGLTMWSGKPITADECVESIVDINDTRVEWLMEPDDIPGERKGVILVTDESGNSTKADVTVTVISDITPPAINGVKDINACINDNITLLENITVTDNKDNAPTVSVSLNVADCYVAGEYPIKYIAEDAAGNTAEAECILTLSIDTVAPVINCKESYNIPVSTNPVNTDITLLPSITDNSASKPIITVSGTVDQTVEGSYPVVFTVADRTGNSTTAECTVNVGKDVTPPNIGLNPIQIFVGDSVSYKNHTTVTDDFIGTPTLEVDSSNVNLDVAGKYAVTFTATDASGNISTAVAPVLVVERPTVEEETHKMIDELLDEITTPDMTTLEKLWAAYYWINTNIRYISTSDKSNYIIGAYDGLTNRQGDCYNYYSLIRIVVEHLGLEHREVTRDSNVLHYWNFVNYNGEWYHVDASRFARGNCLLFMLTDAEAEAWDRAYYSIGHIYDHSLYPEISTKSLQHYVDYVNKRIIKN